MINSRSNDIKDGFRKGFVTGQSKLGNRVCYGYRKGANGELVADPEQAKVVRWIFEAYLSGATSGTIAKALDANGIPSRSGNGWSRKTIDPMLVNEKYVGKVLLQKFISENGCRARNKGEEAQYLVHGHHEGILAPELFQAAQDERMRRDRRYQSKGSIDVPFPEISLGCSV